jgi:IS5 family transposase
MHNYEVDFLMTFNQHIMREQYKKVAGLGDRLILMKEQIDWEPFKKIVTQIFLDKTETGGRPNISEIVIVRSMLLQSLYNLSDEELEFQCNDRLSFQNFLDFPKKIPDFTTIWKHRDTLKARQLDSKIWDELQKQLSSKGYEIKKGVIQDATFIEADLGKKRYAEEKKAKKEGREIAYTDKQLSHIDKDAKFAVKNNQIHFGYKNHVKSDADYLLIRKFEVTPANIHDNNIDLVEENDVAAYRDRGYSGKELKFVKVEDKTMIRKDSKKDWVKATNKAISKIRCLGERPFAVIKNVFGGEHTFVKTIERVSIKEMFKCFAYNLYQLVTLRRKSLA